jgi:hypothetical protein
LNECRVITTASDTFMKAHVHQRANRPLEQTTACCPCAVHTHRHAVRVLVVGNCGELALDQEEGVQRLQTKRASPPTHACSPWPCAGRRTIQTQNSARNKGACLCQGASVCTHHSHSPFNQHSGAKHSFGALSTPTHTHTHTHTHPRPHKSKDVPNRETHEQRRRTAQLDT